jgi:hypothetical protein
MAKNAKKTTERATVSRERRLALALRGLLDALEEVSIGTDGNRPVAVVEAEAEAAKALDLLGYNLLEGLPKRITALNEQLNKAIADNNGKEISRLGLELQRAVDGKSPLPQKKAKTEAAKA